MAAGVGALQSALGRVKKKLPNPNKKISVVYMNKNGSVDWPPEDQINRNGVLLVPEQLTELEWELDDKIVFL